MASVCDSLSSPIGVSPAGVADAAVRPSAWPSAVDSVQADPLTWWDAPQEWARFSDRVALAAAADNVQDDAAVWESQVSVHGMQCAACGLLLEQALLRVPGVLSVQVNAASQRACVRWSAGLSRPSAWLAAAQAAGYRLRPSADTSTDSAQRQASRLALWRWLLAGFCMMQVMMYAAPSYWAEPGQIPADIEHLLRWASWVLSLPVMVFCCWPFFAAAGRDLRQGRVGMDLPVALGIAITFAVSTVATFEPQGPWGHAVYFDSLTMFVFFLLTGRWLEQGLRNRTAGALERLMQRLPHSVERQQAGGQFERVSVARLQPGDLIRVLPGETFAADGVLVSGETLADEALLTGESRPMTRTPGMSVLAGSHNLLATVEVRVVQVGRSTRYAQIVALMAQASLDKPRMALLADRVAKPFLLFVLLAAAGAAAYGWAADPGQALMAAVAVLVVTCPCALSLATPSATLTSAGMLARQGVLVRHVQALEALVQVDTVIFDKTGTLTQTQAHLRAVRSRTGVSADQALQLAGALAEHSRHPVARAVRAAAQHLPATAEPFVVTDVQERAGLGLQGRVQPAGEAKGQPVRQLRLGSARFCDAPGATHDGLQVCLADAQGWLADFEFMETLHSDAPETVAALQALGMAVHIVSGDRQAAVQRIADLLGVNTWKSDCLPEEKLAYVQTLQQQGRRVWMVGDGLNDGPVLAGAQVSLTVAGAVALVQAQADLVLVGTQLRLLPRLLTQARRTMRVVKQNLWWAAAYNAVSVPWALSGKLPAWLAGLGMALSSLLVLLNASRLARQAPPEAHR